MNILWTSTLGRRPCGAGYAANTVRHQCLRLRATVRREVAAVQAEHLKRLDLTSEQVLRELTRIGFSDIRQLFDEQNALRPIHSLDEQTAAMIASFEQDVLFSGSGKARKLVGVTKKVKLWDKLQALTTLARHFKLLEPEKQDRKRPLQIIITDAPASGPRVVNKSEGAENSNSAGHKAVLIT